MNESQLNFHFVARNAKVDGGRNQFWSYVAVCKRCYATVRRDPKNAKYWFCPRVNGRGCGRQLDDKEVW